MNIVQHEMAHLKLGMNGAFSGKTYPVTNSAQLKATVERLGDRRKLRIPQTDELVGVTNGSPVVTFFGTDFIGLPPFDRYENNCRVDDLIRFRGEDRFYKIKTVDSDTQITLFEDYVGTDTNENGVVSSGIGFLDPSITGIVGANTNFAIGDKISISGSASNDGTYTVTALSGDTVSVAEGLIFELPGASVTFARVQETASVGFYYIDWVTILMMGDDDYVTDSMNVYPGQAFAGASRFGTVWSEGALSTAPYPVTNWGENRAYNIVFAPTLAWGALDAVFGTGFDGSATINMLYHWGNSESIIEQCTIDCRNTGGSHGGGFIGIFPILSGGTSYVRNCEIKADNGVIGNIGTGHDITESATNTVVEFDNVTIEYSNTYDLNPTIFLPVHLYCDKEITYNINNVRMTKGLNASDITGQITTHFGGITVNQDGAVLNVSRCDVKLDNDSTQPTGGISIESNSVANIDFCNIEVAGTTNHALHVDDAGAVVNVRNSRLVGVSGQAVNCLAGEVNLDLISTANRIGTTVATGTVNIDTAT